MSVSIGTIQVLEPATEEVLADVPRAGVEEADAAIARAKEAFPEWRAVAPADRARILRELSKAIEEAVEDLARVEARNVGQDLLGRRLEYLDGPDAHAHRSFTL